MSPWLDAEVSLFHGATDATPARSVTIGAVLNAIRTGAYRQAIEQVRYIRATMGDDAYKTAKVRLDAVTFGGTFAPTRAKANLVQHSGLIHGDGDHLPDVQDVKQALCADVHTAYCFVSPSGDGLKLGVCVAPVSDDVAYKHAWQAVADYYRQQYGVTWDPSGKDVCRLCFVSWDPALFLNLATQTFPVPPMPTAAPRPPVAPARRPAIPGGRRDRYARQALDTATRMIDASTPGNRHHARTKAAYLLGGYVAGGILTEVEARAALAEAVERNTTHFGRSMKAIEDCLAAGEQAPIVPQGKSSQAPRRLGTSRSGVFARLRRW
jgi:hypothetical protein